MALNPSVLLTQVETAIEALLTGGHESYSIGERSVTRLDLEQLFAERRQLKAEVNRSSRGAIRLAKFQRTSR